MLCPRCKESNSQKRTHSSDSHGHDDVAILVILALSGTELAGRLGIFQFQFYVAVAGGFEEVDDVLRVEADGQRFAVVIGLERIFGLAGFGGRCRKL